MYNYDEMAQRIMTDDGVYIFLIYFYLDEISDWRFVQGMREAPMDEREYLSRYFAARIPGEECFDKIMQEIERIEANGR